MNGLCITAGNLLAAIPIASFSLVVTDGADGVRQEVPWHIEGKNLVSSAPAAKRDEGSRLALVTELPRRSRRIMVTHAPGMPPQEFCVDGRCRPIASLLPGIEATALIELAPCP